MSDSHQMHVFDGRVEASPPSAANDERAHDVPAWGTTMEPDGIHRPRWRNYTAFVLSGGGARGAFQVGALKALLEYGEHPDVVVGTSIGAWNGSWLAREPTIESMERLVEVWHGLDTLHVLLGVEASRVASRQRARVGMRLLMAARRVAAGQPSLYSDSGLRQLIARHQGETTFEDMRIPLRIIAADLTDGTRAVFKSGPVGPAILASSAMPGVFPPVCIDNHVYIDGGALDNCSLETAVSLGARRVFVVECESETFEEPAPLWCDELTPAAVRAKGGSSHALAAVLERMTQVICEYQFRQAVNRLPRGVELHVIRPGKGVPGSVLDFDRAAAWIDHAYGYTRDYLLAHLPKAEPVASAS